MKNKRTKSLTALMAAIILIVAMIVPASAASSIEEQMAANSAAWHIANAAGDTETCERLHQANVALANQAAGSSGSASFNSSSGTWDITTSSGSRITSSGDSSSGGKSTGITYTTTTSSGRVSSSSDSSYSSSSINSYKNNGGTNSGLETAYNNDAARVSADGTYAKNNAVTTTQTASIFFKDKFIGISTPISDWRIVPSGNGNEVVLYHKNTLSTEKTGPVPGYHLQRVSQDTIFGYLEYISDHDFYRNMHPLYPIHSKKNSPPPMKGTKRYRKEQKRAAKKAKWQSVANVISLIDSLQISGQSACAM